MVHKLDIKPNLVQYSTHHKLTSTARNEAWFGVISFTTKWTTDDAATGIVMTRRKCRIDDNCPICGNHKEDLVHNLKWYNVQSIYNSTYYSLV